MLDAAGVLHDCIESLFEWDWCAGVVTRSFVVHEYCYALLRCGECLINYIGALKNF